MVSQPAHPGPRFVRNDVIADAQGTFLDEHRRQYAGTLVEYGLDDDAFHRCVRVSPQVFEVSHEGDHLQQAVDAGTCLGADLDRDGVATVFLGDQFELHQVLLDPVRIGLGQVGLVDGDDDGYAGSTRMGDGLTGLRHDAVISRHHDDSDVGGAATALTDRGERLVPRGVEEGDVAAWCLDTVSPDVLGDAAGLAVSDFGAADVVRQRGLAVVDVTHHGDYGGALRAGVARSRGLSFRCGSVIPAVRFRRALLRRLSLWLSLSCVRAFGHQLAHGVGRLAVERAGVRFVLDPHLVKYVQHGFRFQIEIFRQLVDPYLLRHSSLVSLMRGRSSAEFLRDPRGLSTEEPPQPLDFPALCPVAHPGAPAARVLSGLLHHPATVSVPAQAVEFRLLEDPSARHAGAHRHVAAYPGCGVQDALLPSSSATASSPAAVSSSFTPAVSSAPSAPASASASLSSPPLSAPANSASNAARDVSLATGSSVRLAAACMAASRSLTLSEAARSILKPVSFAASRTF